MTEHTPLPWAYQEASDAYTHYVRSGDRFVLSAGQRSTGESEANARLIVKAVNHHAELVKMLVIFAERPGGFDVLEDDELERARALLAKVGDGG